MTADLFTMANLVIDTDWAVDHPPVDRCLAIWWPNWSGKNGPSLFCGELGVGTIMGPAGGIYTATILWKKWVDTEKVDCPRCGAPVVDPRWLDRVKGNFLVCDPRVMVLDMTDRRVTYNCRDAYDKLDARFQAWLDERPEWGSARHVKALKQTLRQTTWRT
jgi:hypothetical protein